MSKVYSFHSSIFNVLNFDSVGIVLEFCLFSSEEASHKKIARSASLVIDKIWESCAI